MSDLNSMPNLATEPNTTAGEQASVSGDLEIRAVLRTGGIVPTTIRSRRRAIAVQRNASAAGARNGMLAVTQLHQLRVQLPERVAR